MIDRVLGWGRECNGALKGSTQFIVGILNGFWGSH